MVVKTHNMLSTSITPLAVGGISLLEDGDGPSANDKLPVLSLGWATELAMGIILEYVDHVAEFNEEVIDGSNIRFARVKRSPDAQALNMVKSIY